MRFCPVELIAGSPQSGVLFCWHSWGCQQPESRWENSPWRGRGRLYRLPRRICWVRNQEGFLQSWWSSRRAFHCIFSTSWKFHARELCYSIWSWNLSEIGSRIFCISTGSGSHGAMLACRGWNLTSCAVHPYSEKPGTSEVLIPRGLQVSCGWMRG